MIDIHCHILPGVDDGPETLEQSLEMARAAVSAGISTVVATPHLRADFPRVKVDEIADRCSELKAQLAAQGIPLAIVPGAEIGLAWALEADATMLAKASYGQAGRDVLLEAPSFGVPMLASLLGQVAAQGYRIVLAHPERLQDLHRRPDLVAGLLGRGVLLQVNASGLMRRSHRRSGVPRAAHELLQRGMVSVVASDGHRGSQHRPISVLADARSAITDGLGQEAAHRLLEQNPAAIISGEPIRTTHHPADSDSQIRRWLRRR